MNRETYDAVLAQAVRAAVDVIVSNFGAENIDTTAATAAWKKAWTAKNPGLTYPRMRRDYLAECLHDVVSDLTYELSKDIEADKARASEEYEANRPDRMFAEDFR